MQPVADRRDPSSGHGPRLSPGLAAAVPIWWTHPDHFDLFTGYLDSRNLMAAARQMVASTLGLIGFAGTILLFSHVGEGFTLTHLLGVAEILGIFGFAMLWLVARWPSPTQSKIFVVGCYILTTGAAALVADPLLSLLCTIAFSMVGGYVAFFHSARWLAAGSLFGMTVSAVFAVRLATIDGASVGVAAFLLVLVAVCTVPVTLQVSVNLLSGDSHVDPLTNGLNVRGLFHAFDGLVARRHQPGDRMTIVLADIDRFKDINDSLGHGAGDAVLINVVGALHNAMPTAIIARTGGEEFVVADIVTDCPERFVQTVLQTFRAVTATINRPVTASVGAVATPAEGLAGVTAPDTLMRVALRAADDAMYRAKRAGGNQYVVTHLPPPGRHAA